MEKMVKIKIIFAALVTLIFIGVVLFCVFQDKKLKISDNEIKEIISKITDDEILDVHYYKECFFHDKDYEEVYFVVTKLKEQVSEIFGDFDYKYYFLDKDGNVFSEYYSIDAKGGLC